MSERKFGVGDVVLIESECKYQIIYKIDGKDAILLGCRRYPLDKLTLVLKAPIPDSLFNIDDIAFDCFLERYGRIDTKSYNGKRWQYTFHDDDRWLPEENLALVKKAESKNFQVPEMRGSACHS